MNGKTMGWIAVLLVAGLLASPAATAQQVDPGPRADAPEAAPADSEAIAPAAEPSDAGEAGDAHGPGRHPVEGAVWILAACALTALSGLSIFAFLLLLVTVFPGTVAKVREGNEQRPVFAFFLGLVNVLFVTLLVGALSNGGGPGGLLALIILTAFTGVAVLGIASRAQMLGARTLALAERQPNAVTSLSLGWMQIFLIGILPVVGWVLFLYWSVSGIGAVLVSMFSRDPKANQEVPGLTVEPPPEEDDQDRPHYAI